MGILEGKGYMKGISEYDESRFMNIVNNPMPEGRGFSLTRLTTG